MCWTQVAVLPHPSVAFQVRSIPGTPAQPAGVPASVKPIVTGAGQLSDAVAEPVCPGSVGSPHCKLLSGGQVITGGVVSTNRRCCTQVAVFPHRSVAVQVRSIPGTPAQPGGVPVSLKLMLTGLPGVSGVVP